MPSPSVTVTYADNTTEEFVDVIGQGAQGIILASRDGRSAVKLYPPSTSLADAQRRAEIILRLINELNPTRDDPYWQDYFTWPEKLVVSPLIGYRMRLAANMKTMANYVSQKHSTAWPPKTRGGSWDAWPPPSRSPTSPSACRRVASAIQTSPSTT